MPFFRRLRSRALAPGRYLTDGRRLLRVLSKFDDGRSVMALVEDCTTFEACCYALLELRAMGFRGVRLAYRGAALESSATGAASGAGVRSRAASIG
jgi:hypothetical protein